MHLDWCASEQCKSYACLDECVCVCLFLSLLCVPHHRTKSDFKFNWGTSDDQLKKANRVARTYFLSLSLFFSFNRFSCVLVASMISSHSGYSFDGKFSLLLTLQVDSSAPLLEVMHTVHSATAWMMHPSSLYSFTHTQSSSFDVKYTHPQHLTFLSLPLSLSLSLWCNCSKSKLKIRAVLDSVVFLESLLEFNLTTQS